YENRPLFYRLPEAMGRLLFSCIILRIRPSFSQADRLSYSIHSACVVGIRIPQIEHTASSD
ncbi:hypothetical protein, partial [Sutterella wadsworthensis]|uniref:hypothetical protein n=1 Tax=Sutterella wadsworthensis TaxID=40545 RepID=UPI00241D449D